QWLWRWQRAEAGIEVVDRPDDHGPVRGWMYMQEEKREGKTFIRVVDDGHESLDALRRQLHFLNSLKDQYSAAMIVLPGDVPLNRMLRESQIPHRPVEHPVAQAKPYTRMQIRVLDHKKFLEAMKLTDSTRGGA